MEQLEIGTAQFFFAVQDQKFDSAQSYAEICVTLCRRLHLNRLQRQKETEGNIV